jgi:hypothetical protein
MKALGMPCPLDQRPLTAQQVEASRRDGVLAQRGVRAAPVIPTYAGLELGTTHEAQAVDWARKIGVGCEVRIRGMRFLKCSEIPPKKLPGEEGQSSIRALTLAFDPQDRLVAIDVFRNRLSEMEARAVMLAHARELHARLGQPTEAAGSLAPGALAGRLFKTAFVHYRFKNYLAYLTATNIPWSGGIAVHEQYSTIPQPLLSSAR